MRHTLCMSPKQRLSLFLWNLYPPFLGAGIRITGVAGDWRWMEARLKFRPWNRNYVGTVFGGSIFSLCDPFHMVLLINRLGRDYVVRDKGGEIRYLRKGLSHLSARFEIEDRQLDEIRNHPEEVQERRYVTQVKDVEDQIVAEVTKILHIRRVKK